jgi:hypothetical protein
MTLQYFKSLSNWYRNSVVYGIGTRSFYCKEYLLRYLQEFPDSDLFFRLGAKPLEKYLHLCKVYNQPDSIVDQSEQYTYVVLPKNSFWRESALRLDVLYSILKSSSFNFEDLQKSLEKFTYKRNGLTLEIFTKVVTQLEKLSGFGTLNQEMNLLNSGRGTRGFWSALVGKRGEEIMEKFA